MNRFMVILTFIAISFSPAFAGNDGRHDRHDRNGGASASSKAEAEANVDVRMENVNKNNNENTNINKPSFSVETGPVSVTGGSNSATANPVVNANPTVTTTTSINNIVEAPKRGAPAPGIPESAGSTPQIFWGLTLPANILGVNMSLEYLRACKPRYKKGLDVRDIRRKGESGLTSITFSPHANYLEQENNDPVGEVSIAEPENESSSDKYVCLGIMKVEALMKKATDSQFDTLTNDAGIFGSNNFKGGYPEVYLVMVPGVIAKNLGVSNRGGGAGIAPAVSDFAGETFRGIGAALSGHKGDTFSVGQLGVTFIVLAKPKEGDRSIEFPTGKLITVYKDSQVK